MNRHRVIFTFIIIASSSPFGARGQSINIDLDEMGGTELTGNGVPSSSYGAAANQPGVWNRVYEGGPPNLTPLVGLDGLPTSCRIIATGGIGSGGGYNNPALSGDYRLLMADFGFVLGANYENVYHFSGFQPGEYRIITYACAPFPNNPVDMSITIAEAVYPIQHISGPIQSNLFLAGVTHSIHDLVLGGSSFDISVRRTVPGPPNDSVCNGFQIVAVPEPGTIFVGLFGLTLLMRRKRRRM